MNGAEKNRVCIRPQIRGKACKKRLHRRYHRRVRQGSRSSQAYRDMLLIRRFEEKAGQLYGMGFIGGFCHLYIGQEAVVTGMQMALKEGDQVITGYRDHGHMLATGMSARAASWQN
jgi:TPP-dependent pyruvate/acetoin dehydrogenase alpha subunit